MTYGTHFKDTIAEGSMRTDTLHSEAELEQHWAHEFRQLFACVAGVALFDTMWVEETPPIGTPSTPWNAISIEFPFHEEIEDDAEEITLGIRCFSFSDADQARDILDDSFVTCCTQKAYGSEMYVPPIMPSRESLTRAATQGLAALKEFKLSYKLPFFIQLMIDDAGVEHLIEITDI